jgi:uncharacterized surface protein with fasciclin (FAS1) repeats
LLAAVANTARAANCTTIAGIACGTTGFKTLCDAVKAAGLNGTLGSGTYTVFAPNDGAFANLPSGTLDALLKDIPALKNILLFHVVAGKKVYKKDLRCTRRVKMANNKYSRTVCRNKRTQLFQKGAGNPRSKMPEIITADIEACNGVIHVVSEVMLPK